MKKNNLQMDEIELTLKKLYGLNELLFDSVMFQESDCYYKYKVLSNEMGKLICNLIEYFDIDL